MSYDKIKRDRVEAMRASGGTIASIATMLHCNQASVSKLLKGEVEEIEVKSTKWQSIRQKSGKRCKCGAILNKQRAKKYDECVKCEMGR